MPDKSKQVKLGDLELTFIRMVPMAGYRLFALVAPLMKARAANDIGAAVQSLSPEVAHLALSTATVVREVNGKLVKIDLTNEDMINRAFTDQPLTALFRAVGEAIKFQLGDFSNGSPTADGADAEPSETPTPSP